MVGSGGGTVTITEGSLAGMVVDIPAGALDGDTNIYVGEVIEYPDLLPEMDGIALLVGIGPSGNVFNVPVTITMPYTGDTPPTTIYYYDEAAGEWSNEGIELIEVDEVNHLVTFTAAHFTVFGAGTGDEPVEPPPVEPPVETTHGGGGGEIVGCFIDSMLN